MDKNNINNNNDNNGNKKKSFQHRRKYYNKKKFNKKENLNFEDDNIEDMDNPSNEEMSENIDVAAEKDNNQSFDSKKKHYMGKKDKSPKKGMSSQNIIDTPENVAVDDIVIEESYAFANRDVEKMEVGDEQKIAEDESYDTTTMTTSIKEMIKNKPFSDEEKEDPMLKQEDDDEDLVITWHRHDSIKKEMPKDFHRGCNLNTENFVFGSNVLRHGQCKLDSFNWLKDYQETPHEGELLVAEVRFKNDRKDFYCYPSELDLAEGELVAVETTIGHDIGIVTMVGSLVEKQRIRKKNSTPVEELKKIYRRARVSDVEKFLESIRLEERTLYKSREIALSLNLDMKLNDIEYQGDRTKAIFYYTADGRVDFRELIKKLAEEFHVRVEMRQIGFRQESAKLGGIGSCGRELCCSSWITDFQSVTTSIARIQQLSPNPQKLAGQCGKLKCCLNYEYDTYVEALKSFPDNHIVLKTKKGDAIHQKSDIFKGLMWYSYTFDKNNMMAIPADKVKEIIEDNNNGIFPEQLEDFAFSKEQQNSEYEDGQYANLSKLE